MVVAPESFFARGPVGALAQPAEVKVNAGRIEPRLELARRSLRPTAFSIPLLAVSSHLSAPMFALRQRGEIDLSGGNGSGFPIHHEQVTPAHEHGFGIELTVDYGWRRVQQGSEPATATPLEPGQPWEVFPQRLGKLKHPPGPTA